MRPLAVVCVALAGMLLAAQAFAQISTWSDSLGSGTRVREVRLTVYGAFGQPEGDFGEMSSSSEGFAKPGAGLGLDFSARFQHDIETGAMILVHGNTTNTDALGKFIGAYYFPSGYPGAPPMVASAEWTLAWVLAKAGYAPQVGEQVRVFVDVYGGVLDGHNPEFKLVASNWSVVHDSQLMAGTRRAEPAALLAAPNRFTSTDAESSRACRGLTGVAASGPRRA